MSAAYLSMTVARCWPRLGPTTTTTTTTSNTALCVPAIITITGHNWADSRLTEALTGTKLRSIVTLSRTKIFCVLASSLRSHHCTMFLCSEAEMI